MPSFSVYVNALSTVPGSVIVPVTLYVAPSPSTNPSPPTVTFPLVNGVPSYVLLSVADVRVTLLFVISNSPSTLSPKV